MSVSFFPFLKRLFILLSIPLLFLSACSQTLSLLQTSNTAHLVWTAPIGGSDGANVIPVVIDNGMAYYNGDKLYAFDAMTGRLKWTAPNNSDIHSPNYPPVVANGVILNFVDDKLHAFDAATGRLQWTNNAISSGTMAAANGVVYVTDGSVVGGRMDALDAATGQRKWTASVGSNIPVTVANGVVYTFDATKDNEKLDAFDAATGQLKWAVPIPTPDSGILASPVVVNGVVYATYDHDYNLYAYDAATGQQKWSTPIDDAPLGPSNGPSPLAVANGIAYIAIPKTNKLYAFSLN